MADHMQFAGTWYPLPDGKRDLLIKAFERAVVESKTARVEIIHPDTGQGVILLYSCGVPVVFSAGEGAPPPA